MVGPVGLLTVFVAVIEYFTARTTLQLTLIKAALSTVAADVSSCRFPVQNALCYTPAFMRNAGGHDSEQRPLELGVPERYIVGP